MFTLTKLSHKLPKLFAQAQKKSKLSQAILPVFSFNCGYSTPVHMFITAPDWGLITMYHTWQGWPFSPRYTNLLFYQTNGSNIWKIYSDEFEAAPQVILLLSSSRFSQQFSPDLQRVIFCGNWYGSFYCDYYRDRHWISGNWELGLLVAVFLWSEFSFNSLPVLQTSNLGWMFATPTEGEQCSRLKLSYGFHFEGLSKFSLSFSRRARLKPRCQFKNMEMKYKTRI